MRETSRQLYRPSISSRDVPHNSLFFAQFHHFFCLPRYFSSPLTSHVQSCATRAYRHAVTYQTYGAPCQASLHATQREIIYRVSHELRSLLWESVPYVKLYRYNPKHLYPKLNGYGDNGRRSLKL